MEVLSPGPGKELEFEPIEIPELNNNGSDPQSEDKVVKVYIAEWSSIYFQNSHWVT